jgi:hypothetical protein
MFGKIVKVLAGSKTLVKKGAAAAQRGDKGVKAKIFAQAGRDAQMKRRDR